MSLFWCLGNVAFSFIYEIAAGMAYLSTQPRAVIHRDISSRNVRFNYICWYLFMYNTSGLVSEVFLILNFVLVVGNWFLGVFMSYFLLAF